MPLDERVLELAALWWRNAEEDCEAARRTGDLPFACCFHSQQAVEKAIKALLILHQIDFAKSHDIGELLELLRHSPTPPPAKVAKGLEALTRYAVETRYPPGDARRTDARSALAAARRFLHWAKRKLHLNSG